LRRYKKIVKKTYIIFNKQIVRIKSFVVLLKFLIIIGECSALGIPFLSKNIESSLKIEKCKNSCHFLFFFSLYDILVQKSVVIFAMGRRKR